MNRREAIKNLAGLIPVIGVVGATENSINPEFVSLMGLGNYVNHTFSLIFASGQLKCYEEFEVSLLIDYERGWECYSTYYKEPCLVLQNCNSLALFLSRQIFPVQ